MEVQTLVHSSFAWLVGKGLRLALILGGSVLLLRLARVVVVRVFSGLRSEDAENGEDAANDVERVKRADTLKSLALYLATCTIVTIATMSTLSELGIDVAPVLAAAGIVGVAVGFGSQQLVQDVIAGVFLLLEDQVRVGDVVQLGSHSGVVERVTLRMVVLRDLAGGVHFVRNGQIPAVVNLTKDYSYYVLDVGVAYRENVDEVTTVLSAVAAELQSDPEYESDILEPLEVLGVDKLGDSAVVVKARIKTLPIKQWRVGRELNRRIKLAFDERNIEIPFPHMTVYMGQDKAGNAPPLPVLLDPTASQQKGANGATASLA